MRTEKETFTKTEIKKIVASCNVILSILTNIEMSVHVKYKQLSHEVHSFMTIECVFVYLYVEAYNYGIVSDVLDTRSELYLRYILVASLVLSEQTAMEECLCKLPATWKTLRSFIENLNLAHNSTDSESLTKCVSTIDSAIRNLRISQFSSEKQKHWFSSMLSRQVSQ